MFLTLVLVLEHSSWLSITIKQDEGNYAVSEKEDGLTMLTSMMNCTKMYWTVLDCTGLYWTVLY